VTAAGREIVEQDLPAELGAPTTTEDGGWLERLDQWADDRLAAKNGQPLLVDALPAFERTLIRVALKRARGKRLEAAKLLGWGRNTLTRKIKELGLDDSV
jgi:two-component system nitrogen regulation response regulator GlnG